MPEKSSNKDPGYYDPHADDPMFGIPEDKLFSASMLDDSYAVDLKKIIQVRNRILAKLYSYCAELSEDLLYEFDFQVVDKVRSMLIDIEVANAFVDMDQRISKEGIAQTGKLILTELKNLIERKELRS